MTDYTIYRNSIENLEYEDILDIFSRTSSYFYLVTREDDGVTEKAQQCLDKLAPFLIKEKKTNSWLTQEILKSRKIAKLYYFKTTPKSIRILKEYSQSIFDWGFLGDENGYVLLPQDIAFFQENDEPLLAVNGHEAEFIVFPAFEDTFKAFAQKHDIQLISWG